MFLIHFRILKVTNSVTLLRISFMFIYQELQMVETVETFTTSESHSFSKTYNCAPILWLLYSLRRSVRPHFNKNTRWFWVGVLEANFNELGFNYLCPRDNRQREKSMHYKDLIYFSTQAKFHLARNRKVLQSHKWLLSWNI